jgi:hypothetical protein
MEIGGHDIHFAHTMTKAAVNMVFRHLRTVWPNAVVEEADDEWLRPLSIGELVQAGGISFPCDVFVFADEAARLAINEHGVTEALADKMIEVIVSEDAFDFVVSTPEGHTGRAVADITQSLAMMRLQNVL